MSKRILFLFCLFCLPIQFIAQSDFETEAIITVDKIIGYENTGLYNGTKYIELYRTANDRHKFFENNEFLRGDLVYNGQFYGQVNLKYDLDADDLLLDIGYEWKFPILKLFKERISEFTLKSKKFINIGTEVSKNTKGFHEVLWSSEDLLLLKKHKKKKFRRIFRTVVYFEFDDDNSYHFKYRDTFYPLDNKSDITSVFPQFKKQISNLYNKKLVKINPEANLILIFGELQKSLENEQL